MGWGGVEEWMRDVKRSGEEGQERNFDTNTAFV